MKRRTQALRIGAFLVGGLALLIAALIVVFGTDVFTRHDRALLRFEHSVYGLQVGAPVVLRGVRLGSVVSIGLAHDADTGRVAIPVIVELDRGRIGDLEAAAGGNARPLDLAALVQRGLAARLATQSLLTGQLYVDLDLRRGAAAAAPPAPRSDGLIEIPTEAGAFQALQDQFATLDVAQLMQDVSALAAAARELVGSAELKQAIGELAQAGTDLRRLIARMDQRIDPLARSTESTLAETRRTLARLGQTGERIGGVAERIGRAADRFGETSAQVGTAAQRVDQLAGSAAPALAGVQQAAEELARSATALRQATSEDSATMLRLEQALKDVGRASRAVRDLADQLQRQPDALLRGRQTSP
jgi:paraquat-inducible protein B